MQWPVLHGIRWKALRSLLDLSTIICKVPSKQQNIPHMPIRTRGSDFLDRGLQLSNAQRRTSANRISALLLMNADNSCLPLSDQTLSSICTTTGGGDLTQLEFITDTSRSVSPLNEEAPSTMLNSSKWMQRSISTPQTSYIGMARRQRYSAEDHDDAPPSPTESRMASPRSSITYGRCSTPSNQLPRPVLIKLRPGTGGLDQTLNQSVTSPFGVGTTGLGGVAVARLESAVRTRHAEEWEVRKDQWLHDDRMREAARKKLLASQTKTKTVSEMNALQGALMDRRMEAVRAEKEFRSAIIKEVKKERAGLSALERDVIQGNRDAMRLEHQRSAEERESHRNALQHLGQLEQAARKMQLLQRHAEMEVQTRRLQYEHRIASATDHARRVAANQQITDSRLQCATVVRQKEGKWEDSLKKLRKSDQLAARDFVKKLHSDLSNNVKMSRSQLEYENSKRHDAIKQDRERLESLKEERESRRLQAAKDAANDLRGIPRGVD